jgi:glycerol kinase
VLRLLGVNDQAAVAALDLSATGVGPNPLRVVQAHPYDEPSIVGLNPTVSPAALWSAALDAVAASGLGIIRTMEAIAGPLHELILSGGWAQCAGLRRRKASLMPVVRWPALLEAGARGAALFGGCAAGIFGSPFDFPAPEDQLLGV